MSDAYLVLRPDGSLILFDAPPELHAVLGTGPIRRVSRIEPTGRLRRWAFYLVRIGTENQTAGRGTAWTRHWRGPWRDTLGGTGLAGGFRLESFPDYPAALAAEKNWLATDAMSRGWQFLTEDAPR